MTLTNELIRDVVTVNPCTKFHDHTPNGSAVRALTDRHTHTHTDSSVFITSTADAGGNNCSFSGKDLTDVVLGHEIEGVCHKHLICVEPSQT